MSNKRTPKPKPKPEPAAARDAVVRRTLRARREQHLYAALSSLGRLLARPGATLLTLFVMALALLLPLLFATVLRNLGALEAALPEQRELAVFLAPGRNDAPAEAAAIGKLPGVAKVSIRTPAEGLDELRRLGGFGPALELLPDNPLPYVLVVTPAGDLDPDAVRALAAVLGSRAGVDLVHYDLVWRERLARIGALARRLALVLGALLTLGALLVVGNTIRLDVGSRAAEIQVLQVVGAEPAFVRRPFLYAGLWYGGAAALLALVGAAAVQLALSGAVEGLARSYGAGFRLLGPGWAGWIGTPVAGIVLGWLGARVAVALELARGRRAAT